MIETNSLKVKWIMGFAQT